MQDLLANIEKSRTINPPPLPWDQVPKFLAALGHCKGAAAKALVFAVLTACRSGEVRGAMWSELDLKEEIWTIPAALMRAGREHLIPLTTNVNGKVLSDMTLTAVIRRMNEASDEPTWLDSNGERITHSDSGQVSGCGLLSKQITLEVAENALAHQLPDALERAYQRGTQLAKRQALRKDWGDYCFGAAKLDAPTFRTVHRKSAQLTAIPKSLSNPVTAEEESLHDFLK